MTDVGVDTVVQPGRAPYGRLAEFLVADVVIQGLRLARATSATGDPESASRLSQLLNDVLAAAVQLAEPGCPSYGACLQSLRSLIPSVASATDGMGSARTPDPTPTEASSEADVVVQADAPRHTPQPADNVAAFRSSLVQANLLLSYTALSEPRFGSLIISCQRAAATPAMGDRVDRVLASLTEAVKDDPKGDDYLPAVVRAGMYFMKEAGMYLTNEMELAFAAARPESMANIVRAIGAVVDDGGVLSGLLDLLASVKENCPEVYDAAWVVAQIDVFERSRSVLVEWRNAAEAFRLQASTSHVPGVSAAPKEPMGQVHAAVSPFVSDATISVVPDRKKPRLRGPKALTEGDRFHDQAMAMIRGRNRAAVSSMPDLRGTLEFLLMTRKDGSCVALCVGSDHAAALGVVDRQGWSISGGQLKIKRVAVSVPAALGEDVSQTGYVIDVVRSPRNPDQLGFMKTELREMVAPHVLQMRWDT